MDKLKDSIPANGVKIIDLYNKIDSRILDTSPTFQRKLVWKKQHKYAFIETILLNYPFPEIYIASAEMDIEKFIAKEIVVDGQQRLNTIVDYIKGINDFNNQNKIRSFDSLTTEEKKDFLNYQVTVKDLKNIDKEIRKEIFKRINSTEYSLNTIEKNNAQYGDGEFAVFCKQIIDKEYNPTEIETDIILDKNIKTELNSFFINNEVFNENDKSRMFDVQYIMLLISTFLEGDYFARSIKVNEYLEKYNNTFDQHIEVQTFLLNSIRIINKLNLTKYSYWFNKANLFTLIIELSKLDLAKLDLSIFESQLLELETKVDLYFSSDESIDISEEEKKYFEVARQGSHEKSARIHRGKVVKKLINNSLLIKETPPINNVSKNLTNFKIKNIPYSLLIPTETGLSKSIMDAVSSVREFLKVNNIHDYEIQEFGPANKVKLNGKFILKDNTAKTTEISLYRSNGRGDYRIWFSDLKEFADANDNLALIIRDSEIHIYNISRDEYKI